MEKLIIMDLFHSTFILNISLDIFHNFIINFCVCIIEFITFIEKETWKAIKPDYLASWTLICAFFVLVFNFVLLET